MTNKETRSCSSCGIKLKSITAKLCRKCYLLKLKKDATPKRCCDCGMRLKNRSKLSKRCRKCLLVFWKKTKTGRKTGNCKKCGRKLSSKKNKTGTCSNCFSPTPWNKDKKGSQVAWNKGISRFKNVEDKRVQMNERRKEIRKYQSSEEKIADRIRTLIRNAIKHKSAKRKSCKTTKLLGCSINFFRQHLENQFVKTMSWDNYGNNKNQWNIDHIIPISKFDLNKIEQQLKAFNYTNCQPMWAIDNFKKGNNV